MEKRTQLSLAASTKPFWLLATPFCLQNVDQSEATWFGEGNAASPGCYQETKHSGCFKAKSSIYTSTMVQDQQILPFYKPTNLHIYETISLEPINFTAWWPTRGRRFFDVFRGSCVIRRTFEQTCSHRSYHVLAIRISTLMRTVIYI